MDTPKHNEFWELNGKNVTLNGKYVELTADSNGIIEIEGKVIQTTPGHKLMWPVTKLAVCSKPTKKKGVE